MDIADTINKKLSFLADKKVLTLRFLSEHDPFEASLKAHFRKNLTDLESLLNMRIKKSDWFPPPTTPLITGQFFPLIERDQLIGALAYLKDWDLSSTKNKKDLARTVWFEKLREEMKKAKGENNQLRKAFFYNPGRFSKCSTWTTSRKILKSWTRYKRAAVAITYIVSIIGEFNRTWRLGYCRSSRQDSHCPLPQTNECCFVLCGNTGYS
eukprot:scaffold10259_cov155-Amphora_coffeaeformis.AAC.3